MLRLVAKWFHRWPQWATVNHMPTTPQYMTVAEFGVRMAMPEHMVRKRIRKGEIRAVNISASTKPEYRISEAELARYVAERDTLKGTAA